MKTRVILSVIGSDRPGLTQSLADAVFHAGGNWLESHLGRLGGKYVGSVLVELDASNLHALEQAVGTVDGTGLRVSSVAAGDEPAPGAETFVVELIGQDRPGIVLELTAALSALGVNIEDFRTSTENSGWSGNCLFRASARLVLPEGTSAEQVRSALEGVSGEIMVDFPTPQPSGGEAITR